MSIGFFFAALILTFIASMVLPALVSLLLPGRKGSMRTRRQLVHDGIRLEQACDLYARRLEHDGFEVDLSGAPAHLKARRGSLAQLIASGQTVTHAVKPTSVEIWLEAEGNGVAVTADAWLNDFVLHDTGEGRQLDLLLTRLTEADLAREAPPAVPLTSYHAMTAITAGLLTCAAPWIVRAFSFTREPPERTRSLLLGMLVSGAGFCVIGAFHAIRDADAKPAEITGKPLAYAAMAVGAVSAVLCVAALLGAL